MTKQEAIELVATVLARAGGFDLADERRMSVKGSLSSEMLVEEFGSAAALVVEALIDNCSMTLKSPGREP